MIYSAPDNGMIFRHFSFSTYQTIALVTSPAFFSVVWLGIAQVYYKHFLEEIKTEKKNKKKLKMYVCSR